MTFLEAHTQQQGLNPMMSHAFILLHQTVSRPSIPLFPVVLGTHRISHRHKLLQECRSQALFLVFLSKLKLSLIYFPDGLVPVTTQVKSQGQINAALNIINSSSLHPLIKIGNWI